jgi:phosphoribosylformylglycinamidine (FGAM) synthase PurS component
MEVKFKIIELHSDQHSIVVRYYTDLVTEDSLATSYAPDGSILRREDGSPQRCQTDYNINIWKTEPTPTEEDIKNIAKSAAPFDWFKLKHDVLNPQVDTSLNVVNSLLNTEFVATRPVFNDTETLEQSKELTEQEIENMINSLSANTSNT